MCAAKPLYFGLDYLLHVHCKTSILWIGLPTSCTNVHCTNFYTLQITLSQATNANILSHWGKLSKYVTWVSSYSLLRHYVKSAKLSYNSLYSTLILTNILFILILYTSLSSSSAASSTFCFYLTASLTRETAIAFNEGVVLYEYESFCTQTFSTTKQIMKIQTYCKALKITYKKNLRASSIHINCDTVNISDISGNRSVH